MNKTKSLEEVLGKRTRWQYFKNSFVMLSYIAFLGPLALLLFNRQDVARADNSIFGTARCPEVWI